MPSYQEYRLPKAASLSDFSLKTVDALPQVKPGEVLVKIHAVSLNFRDLMITSGQYPISETESFVPCSDAAGEIVSVGNEVKEFKVGDKVLSTFFDNFVAGEATDVNAASALGAGIDGVLTQYRVFPERGLVHMPSHLTYEEGSTLPCAAVTAWNALYCGPKPLKAGDTVLLQGTGGVSTFGLIIANASGAKTIMTSSNDDKIARVKQMGATHTINYKKTPDWEKEVMKLTNGKGCEHIVEVGGQGTLNKSLQSVARGGSINIIGLLSQSQDSTSVIMPMIFRSPIMRGIYVGNKRSFQDMNKALEARSLKPVVDKVFPFKQAREAYEYMKSQKHMGKIVIKVSE